MSAPAERPSSLTTVEILERYLAEIAGRDYCKNTRRHRETAARRFAEANPGLSAWIQKSAPARITQVRRLGAMGFIQWCLVEGHLHSDLEFILAVKPHSLYVAWARRHPDQAQRVAEVGDRIGWSKIWVQRVSQDALGLICMWSGKRLDELADPDFAAFLAELERVPSLAEFVYARVRARTFGLHQACFQLGLCAQPPREWHRGPWSLSDHLAGAVPQPAIHRVIERYLETVATTLSPGTMSAKRQSLIAFAEYLQQHHPDVRRLSDLDRQRHVEPFLIWNRTRPYRGRKGYLDRPIAASTAYRAVGDVRLFFSDLSLWGWAERPRRQLLFDTDTGRKTEPLPFALAPDADRDLMREIRRIDDPFERCALVILRGTGMRISEVLDLELDCLWDTPSHGTWVKVPLGKLKRERMVPLDAETLEAFDAWMSVRGVQRAVPNPRDNGRTAEFLFMAQGRRLSAYRLRRALRETAGRAGLKGKGGKPPRVTPHQLRHTYGTSLINAGMSLEALMALLGHATPQMTLRYAKLASPTIRAAYDAAMEKVKARSRALPLAGLPGPSGPPPDRIEWLRSEMLKTRVAHGYCSRHLAADACPYANICEQCDNYVTAPDFLPALEAQLADVRVLREDAEARGWDSEVARHARVIARIEGHIGRLDDRVDVASVPASRS